MIKKPPFLTDVVNELAINNNEASYKMLFSYLFNPLLRFSFSLLKSRELAEEVASDIMFILWQRRVPTCYLLITFIHMLLSLHVGADLFTTHVIGINKG